ncbi:alpha-glucan family phosphorylase [Planctopirus hydrillae]|uniref:Alpha-glucan phosphorylase n=1 Tax=Planctopirus hydrillae TaxID=1841610 RepID=A0A1C3EA03_9PLAN|nr:alpha-glucan family phosphorylase [Planctopirus hydrillae]ODA30063.1 alpha-glucan phosphorylase [Planctopirus hydrillae]
MAKSFRDKLYALARNYWWCWQPDVTSIFRDLDAAKWRELDHNPVLLLESLTEDQLEQRARESVLHSRVNYAYRRCEEYLHDKNTWGALNAGILGQKPVAYFSAEFGIHESLPNYSGGLGVLAGDHLKSASDLGVPLVAVGLLYNEGYFSQQIDEDGWQREIYDPVSNHRLPIQKAKGLDGKDVIVKVDTRTGSIYAQAWQVNVGRVRLFLLDTNIEQNTPEDRRLTARLYGGDVRIRIRQEVILGIGGVRALAQMGIVPNVVHMNEGHSAFATLELIRQRMNDDGMSFTDAMRETTEMCVFTTHTPVPAGHDRFGYDMIDEHLGPTADQLGIGTVGLIGLGRVNVADPNEPFTMTVLAFKCSRRANGVSALHGMVSRRMWTGLWPNKAEHEIPIGHITNGVHLGTWLAPQLAEVYNRVLPPDWKHRSGEADTWKNFESISSGEFWEAHEALKQRLIAMVRRRMITRAQRLNHDKKELVELESLLNPEALTIGFARRFAPYKRADLVLKDVAQLAGIVADSERPVQLIFAGKSHPADDFGKGILQRIFKMSQDPAFKGKVVLVENYDMNLARHLVQGVDVWLNNPRRPLEASGTSGQKVVLNGGLNCSILDGWWAEAYDGLNGFAIGNGRIHSNQEIQDERDAKALMKVLQEEVIPLFYDRDEHGQPHNWIKHMKRSVRTLGWRFNSDRQVMDYVMKGYIPAAGGEYCEMDRFH